MRLSNASLRRRPRLVGMTPAEVGKLRMKLRFTQEQFAALNQVSAMTVSRWERGAVTVTPTRALAIKALTAPLL